MSHTSIILSVVVAALLVLVLWNAIGFRELKRRSQLREKELNDAKYWELSTNMNF